MGTSALKTIISKTSIDKVNDTMDNLADVLADHQEIEQAMADGQEYLLSTASTSYSLDEDDLERELDALIELEGRKEKGVEIEEDGDDVDKLAETLHNLPSISTPLPTSLQTAKSTSQTTRKENAQVAN